jgi:hypothetical protein
MHRRVPFFAAFVFFSAALLCACGGNSMVGGGGAAPVFSSTPVLQASQGAVYTYELAASDPMGGMVSFALTSAPAGAMLNGSTVTWTPTAAESRVANNFVVTARTSEGGAATQSWSVTPSGNVIVSRVDTHWEGSGAVSVPFDWPMFPAAAAEVMAMVPQPNGGFLVFNGTGNADGTLTIPNVPGGFYWLATNLRTFYWTSQGAFDIGTDFIGPVETAGNTLTTTTWDLSVSGLDPIQAGDEFEFFPGIRFFDISFSLFGPVGATSITTKASVKTNDTLPSPLTSFLFQLEPLPLGPLNLFTMGPEETLPNSTYVDGGTNSVTGTLSPSPKSSFDLNVQGTSWTSLLENAGPSPMTVVGSTTGLIAEPNVTGANVLVVPDTLAPDLPLVSAFEIVQGLEFTLGGPIASCLSNARTASAPDEYGVTGPPILTDQNFGTVEYVDPFPAGWARAFSFCQTATMQLPVPNSASTVPFQLADGEITAVPTATIAPLVSAVQNATMNGASLFTPSTSTDGKISLSWSAPAQGTPIGYSVEVFLLVTLNMGAQVYAPAQTFSTAKTSMTLPVSLQAGRTAVFVITALADGRANLESMPLRAGLPRAFASIVSAPVTVSAAAQVAAGPGGLFLSPQPASGAAETPSVVTRRLR